MHEEYADIKALTDRDPLWYDSNGVPRYCKPHPGACPNIYAEQVIFYWIQCASCNERFLVEEHFYKGFNPYAISLEYKIRHFNEYCCCPIHYGDPPFHRSESGKACAGTTMNSDPLHIAEFWLKNKATGWEWMRKKDYEIALLIASDG